MARSYGTTNAAPYASAPAVGAAGDTYYNTASKTFYLSDGTAWNAVSGGGAGTTTYDGFTRYGATGADVGIAAGVNDVVLATVGEYAGSTYTANGTNTRFTIPASGVYDITGHISATSSGFLVGTQALLTVNGITVARESAETTTAYVSLTVSLIRWLNAGDAVGLAIYSPSSWSFRWQGGYGGTDARQPFLSVWRSGGVQVALNSGVVGAAGVVARAEVTTAQTGISSSVTDLTGLTVTFTAIAGRRYEVLGGGCFTQGASATWITYYLAQGGSTIQLGGESLSAGFATGFSISKSIAPAAGSVTLKLQANTNTGTATMNVGATNPAFLEVIDVGIDGQVQVPSAIVTPDVWNVGWGTIAQSVVGASGSSTTNVVVDLAGSSITWTPVVGRRYRITGEANAVIDTPSNVLLIMIRDSANTVIGQQSMAPAAINSSAIWNYFTFVTPASAAALTYKLSYQRQVGAGNVYLYGDSATFNRIVIEDVGPVSPIAPANWYVAQYPKVSEGNALGIVAMGATTGVNGFGIAANTLTDVSQPLSFTPLVGRRYRLTYRLRATAGPSQGAYLRIAGDNIATNDSWTFLVGSYDSMATELVFDGTGAASTYKVQFFCPGAATIWNDQNIGQFYVEDCGPNSTPALPIPATDPPWIAVTGMQNSWITPQGAGQPPAMYRKIGDIVYLRGTIGFGTLNTTAFVLPAGFRPPIQIATNVVCGGQTFASVVVNTDGTVVQQYGNNTYCSMAPIHFSTTA